MEVPELTYIIIFGLIIIIVMLGFLVFVWFQYFKRNSRYNHTVKTMELQYRQELLQTQIEIQEQTLRNISQEIHDNIGQALSLAKLNLSTFPETEDLATSAKINDTRQLVGKAIQDLRNLSHSMHGDRVAELGLREAISAELRMLQNTGQFATNMMVEGTAAKMEPQKEMILFRIVQEALNNAVKHSGAGLIQVKLEYNPGNFLLIISDNGRGFEVASLASATAGIGIKNMQNRAALIGGQFSIQSGAAEGTRISISFANTAAAGAMQ